MALPATGSIISMSQIRNYFSSSVTPVSLRATLGPFLGITTGTVPMSSTFGGYYFPILP